MHVWFGSKISIRKFSAAFGWEVFSKGFHFFFFNKNRAKSSNSNHYERCATQINFSDNPGYDILAIYYVFVQVWFIIGKTGLGIYCNKICGTAEDLRS